MAQFSSQSVHNAQKMLKRCTFSLPARWETGPRESPPSHLPTQPIQFIDRRMIWTGLIFVGGPQRPAAELRLRRCFGRQASKQAVPVNGTNGAAHSAAVQPPFPHHSARLVWSFCAQAGENTGRGDWLPEIKSLRTLDTLMFLCTEYDIEDTWPHRWIPYSGSQVLSIRQIAFSRLAVKSTIAGLPSGTKS